MKILLKNRPRKIRNRLSRRKIFKYFRDSQRKERNSLKIKKFFKERKQKNG